MPASRYKVVPPWTADQFHEAVVVETADLLDTRTNTRYQDGAYRVRLLKPVEGYRTKTFKGETAWSDAARLRGDIIERYRHDLRAW